MKDPRAETGLVFIIKYNHKRYNIFTELDMRITVVWGVTS